MTEISVKMNQREERIINSLAEHFQEDKSSVIKRSLFALYEDVIDIKQINEFEKGEHKFIQSKDILQAIK